MNICCFYIHVLVTFSEMVSASEQKKFTSSEKVLIFTTSSILELFKPKNYEWFIKSGFNHFKSILYSSMEINRIGRIWRTNPKMKTASILVKQVVSSDGEVSRSSEINFFRMLNALNPQQKVLQFVLNFSHLTARKNSFIQKRIFWLLINIRDCLIPV